MVGDIVISKKRNSENRNRYKNIRLIGLVFTVILFQVSLPTAYGASNLSNFDLTYITDDTLDFNVNIYFLGSTWLKEDQITPSSQSPIPVFEYESQFTAFTPLVIKANISGFTSWDLGYYQNPINNQSDFLGVTTTFGQLYLIMDHQVAPIANTELGTGGISVNVPLGDHTITVLMIGMDENNGIMYASDSIVVRIYNTETVLTDYVTHAFPINIEVNDVYEKKTIQAPIVDMYEGEDNSYSFDKRTFFEPTTSTQMIVNNGTSNEDVKNLDILLIDVDLSYNFIILSNVNSTGVSGIQLMHTWTSTQGLNLLIDAAGVHPVNKTMVSLTDGNNFVGIATFSPYGLWHQNISTLSTDFTSRFTPDGFPDWEGRIISIGDIEYDSSFDFVTSVDGQYFHVSLNVQKETTTISTLDNTPGLQLVIIFIPILLTVISTIKFRKIDRIEVIP